MVTESLARRSRDVSGNTARGWDTRAKNHIYPEIGDVRLRLFDEVRAQRWVDWVSTRLSPNTVPHVVDIVDQACAEAVKLRIIERNPLAGVRLPRRIEPTHRTWTADEVERVLAYIAGEPMWHAYYRLAIATGMRPGELRALQWGDIDVKGTRVHVMRTMTRTRDGAQVVGVTTKTGRVRDVAMPPRCVDALRSWQRVTAFPFGVVFCQADGSPLSYVTIANTQRRIARRAGVTVITPHEIRHTNATMELAAGTPLKIVSQRLGHSNTQTTSNLYQHPTQEMHQDAADAFEARLDRASSRASG